MQFGRKAGKQRKSIYSSDSSEASSEESSDSSEDEDSDADEPSGSDDDVVKRPASPSNNLVSALEGFTLSSLRMQKTGQLPFLLRNLRRGFTDRCQLLGIPVEPAVHSDKPLEIHLTFRLQTRSVVSEDATYSDEYQTRMTSWTCPLCDLHGKFKNHSMLQKHIEWDHSEINMRWAYDEVVSI